MIYCNPNNDEEIQLMTPNNNNLTWTDTTTTDTWDTSLLRMGYIPYYYWDTLPTIILLYKDIYRVDEV